MSKSRKNSRRNCHRNVFDALSVGIEDGRLVEEYLAGHDFSENTIEAIRNDLRKFAKWFANANQEPLRFDCVTTRDVVDFRKHLHRERQQAVATCNRALVTIRRLFTFLVSTGAAKSNPAEKVKELRKTELPPKGLDRSAVRGLLRQVELQCDIRANAIFHLLLYTGARVGDVVNLELPDLMVGVKSGYATFRHGKGRKERTVPLSLECRKALSAYLDIRPPANSDRVFIGERGPLATDGIQALCRRYSVLVGQRLHPHIFRHTFAKKFLEDNGNDLTSLAMLLGHSNIQTTARYAQKDQAMLAAAAENVTY
jgi:site-specific recombinase XerD